MSRENKIEEFMIKDKPNLYVRYASDANGTGFSATPSPTLKYIAILASETRLNDPKPADFIGLWQKYIGDDGQGGGGTGTVDQEIIEGSPRAVAGGAVYTAVTELDSKIGIVGNALELILNEQE